MQLSQMARLRLRNQQLSQQRFSRPAALVSWMGAMQAQDASMIKWAVGCRLSQTSEAQITAALDAGELIRTHLLRPTWHVIAATDIYWLLDVSAPQVKTLLRSRFKQLGIDAEILAKTYRIITQSLSGHRHLTRAALMTELAKESIATDENRASHLMMAAELDGLVCNGVREGKQLTYALLAERVPKTSPLTREEALAKLAQTYFSSHGPATLPDFVWWSGLTVTDARRALASVQSQFESAMVEGQTYWFLPDTPATFPESEDVFLLPAFDEYTVSYKDRTAVLAPENHQQAISGNGIFNPIIVMNGQVVGIWKRTLKKNSVTVAPTFFERPPDAVLPLIDKAAERFGRFLGLKAEVPAEGS